MKVPAQGRGREETSILASPQPWYVEQASAELLPVLGSGKPDRETGGNGSERGEGNPRGKHAFSLQPQFLKMLQHLKGEMGVLAPPKRRDGCQGHQPRDERDGTFSLQPPSPEKERAKGWRVNQPMTSDSVSYE